MKWANKHRRLFQYLATISGTFSVIISGVNLGWTSPYLPGLLDESSPIPTTSDEGSWCAVMPLVGAPVGALLAAMLIDRIGRKLTVLLCVPVTIVTYLMIALAKSITIISFARFVCGSVEGALYTLLPIYIGEISDPEIRGKLSAAVPIAGVLGTLFINILGPWTSIFTSSIICILIPLVHFLTFMWMPESPYYYLKKHQHQKAENSLKILRGSQNVQEEMAELQEAVKRQEGTKRAKITDFFTVPSNRRATLVIVVICMTNKFSGKNPFIFYTSMIFRAAHLNISPDVAVIIYCVVEIFATLLAMVFVDKFGRRPLLIFSTCGCAISLILEGLYFYLNQYHEIYVESLGWLAVFILIVYNVIFSFGLGFVGLILRGELFPTNIKGLALGLADCYSVSMGTIASKFFQVTNDKYGMFVPFWSFGACCFFFLPFIIKLVPETKGKTLEEIQLHLIGNKKI